MTNFDDKYTTKEKKTADPIKEAGKMEITNDAFAVGDLLNEILEKLEHMRTRLR